MDPTPPAVRLHLGDCLTVMKGMEAGSVDAVVCDPPYPGIKREYGYWTEPEWHAMMRVVVAECRRILKPSGSAVFVLQPNSERVGKMRPWLWDFLAWACREWNQVQDAWWWRFDAMPTAGAPDKGMMRQSLKACVWLGPPDCYRDQDSVLWSESDLSKAQRLAGRFTRRSSPANWRLGVARFQNEAKMRTAAGRRGGVTPFNVLPCGCDGKDGKFRHTARTPLILVEWWIRYISPPGGVVCDPFMGSGTVGLAALRRGRSFIGIEKYSPYFTVAQDRLAAERARTPLFA